MTGLIHLVAKESLGNTTTDRRWRLYVFGAFGEFVRLNKNRTARIGLPSNLLITDQAGFRTYARLNGIAANGR